MKNKGQIDHYNLFSDLKERVYSLKLEEISYANENYVSGELEERLDIIESDYTFNLFKLDEILELSSRSEENQRKFVEMDLYIENMDISFKQKIQTILTSACVLNRVNTRTQDLKNNEFFLLSAVMVPVPLNEYGVYGSVLSHPTLLNTVMEKSDDLSEQIAILDSVFDYCDDFTYDDMTELDYNRAVFDLVNIVKNYQIENKKRTK